MKEKIIFFIFIFILFLFLFSNNSHTKETRAYYHEVPDNIQILFPKQSFKKWLTYIEEIKINKTHITEEYKKSFKIKGAYVMNDKEYKFSGKARITGDWTDHINFKRNYSSLSISLKKGNIGGITKFRLLIPITRHGYNEIFWTTLINELGFYSPHRQMINAHLQSKNIIMIFEEKPEKEFLESRGFRDTPSIEFDERQNWETEKFKKIISKNLTQLKIKNRSFLKNETAYKIAMRSLYYPALKNNKIYHDLYKEINTPEAEHGIDGQNDKFVYDGIYNSHYPIYFDGDVNFINSNCDKNKIPKIPDDLKIKMNLLETKYNKFSLGKNLTNEMKCVAIRKMILLENDKKLEKKIFPLKNFKMDQIKILNMYEGTIFNDNSHLKKNPVTIIKDNFDIKNCKYSTQNKDWSNCKKLEFSSENIKNILSGDDKPEIFKQYKLYPIHIFSYSKEKVEKFKIINLKNEKNYNINVNKNETKFIKANIYNSKIKILLADSTSKIVFYNSKIVGTNIETKISSNKEVSLLNESKFDERLLTGCITLIDSEIINSHLFINNCKNEDSINFIRVEGSENKVNVKNAKYDGVDLDFSKIFFDKINIQNSGNDCLDVSGGVYNIKFFYGNNCNDKGISVGEKSLVTVNNIDILNSETGFALKDSSTLHILEGKFKNNNICGEIYKKKTRIQFFKTFY